MEKDKNTVLSPQAQSVVETMNQLTEEEKVMIAMIVVRGTTEELAQEATEAYFNDEVDKLFCDEINDILDQ